MMFARFAAAFNPAAAGSCNAWLQRQPLSRRPARKFWASSLRDRFQIGEVLQEGDGRAGAPLRMTQAKPELPPQNCFA
jgi:hypothetical protein